MSTSVTHSAPVEGLQVLFNFYIERKEGERTKVFYLAHNDLSYLNSCLAKCSVDKNCLSSTKNRADLYQIKIWSAIFNVR